MKAIAGKLILTLGILLYIGILCPYISPYAGGSDSSGYLNFAELLRHGHILAPVRSLPEHGVTEFGSTIYQPLGFNIRNNSGFMSPTYPIGLPLHLSLASLLSTHPVLLVNVLAILATMIFVYAIGRHLALKPIWAILATTLLCLCPQFLSAALQPMSDLLATTWAMAALYCALRNRDHAAFAFLCGTAAMIAVLVRPTNSLLIFPLLIAIGLNPKRLIATFFGALPALLLQLYVNEQLYDSLFTTGYGNVSGLFSIHYVRHHLQFFAYWIPILLSPIILFALIATVHPRIRTREWLVLISWFIILVGFYAFYFCAGDSCWYLRFLLPSFPILTLLASAGIENIIQQWERTPVRLFIVIAILFSLCWQLTQISRRHVFNTKNFETTYPLTTQWANNHLPSNALVLSVGTSGALYHDTKFTVVRWDSLNEQASYFLKATLAQHLPIYAILQHYEIGDARFKKLGGTWNKLTIIRNDVEVFKLIAS